MLFFAVTLTHPACSLTNGKLHTHVFTKKKERIKAIQVGLEAPRSGPGERSLQAHSIMTISTQAPQLELINGLLLCRYMQGREQSASNKWAWWTRERQGMGGVQGAETGWGQATERWAKWWTGEEKSTGRQEDSGTAGKEKRAVGCREWGSNGSGTRTLIMLVNQ